jgi:Tol biopolymer transport system component
MNTKLVLRHFLLFLFACGCCFSPSLLLAQNSSGAVGIFTGQLDVGSVTPPGASVYDAATGTYTIDAAGTNLWSTTDGFHLLWKKVSGDLSLTAEMNFPVTAGNPSPHRKAVLIFRQTLDADGVYADAAQHGSGLTALQYRRSKGATTQDIELNIAAPRRVRLEKRGDTITLFLSMGNEPLHPVGASIKMHFEGPFYAGIGVCSHNQAVVEKATFTHVELKALTQPTVATEKVLYSTLQTIGIEDNFRRATVIANERGYLEAPNWSRDGKTLVFDRDGRIWTVPAEGGKPAALDTGNAIRCNGSHGFSPDGALLAITCATTENPDARVYLVPAGGGAPRILTAHPQSYFHSWSPDGKTILFTRPDHGSLNIFAIPAAGGEEKALTTGSGTSDDPDFSADGQSIYFNSDRAGGPMQIWRMNANGSHPEQVTHDSFNNWTPHPSPDGKSIVFISYDRDVSGHPANKDVALRILNPQDGQIRVLVNLVGGAGTMNVPSWAPDSKSLAFVSYQMLPAAESGSTE